MTCSSPSSKKILVSLDTSDTINLNHLDVIPMQLNFGSLDKSIVNVDIDKQGISLNQYEGTENDEDDEDEDPRGKSNKGNIRRIGQRSRSNGLVDQYYEGGNKFKRRLNKRITKSTSQHHQKEQQQQTLKPSQSQLPAAQSHSQHNKQDSKAIASSSFDRYGRLTRVTANYADDYRTTKLRRKMSHIRRRKATYLSDKQSNTSREHLSRSRGHRYKTQKTSVAAKNRAVDVELDDSDDEVEFDDEHAGDKFSKEIVRQIRELGLEDGMKTSAAFAKLTQALKDLQISWEEDLLAAKTAESLKFDDDERKMEFSANTLTYSSPQILTNTFNNNNQNNPINMNGIRKQEDLLTLCPTKIDPFLCQSSHCSVFPDNLKHNLSHNANDNENINDIKSRNIRDESTKNYPIQHHDNRFSSKNPLTQSDAITFSKETPGDYFRSPTPSPSEIMDLMEATKHQQQQQQQSNNHHHGSMPELSEQKQVDIWNWVSSKCSGQCQGQGQYQGLFTINLMAGDQDPISTMNFPDDDQTFSLCSVKDQDGSFTDGEGDETHCSPLRKSRSILRHRHQTITIKNSQDRLHEFVQEFLYNGSTKLTGVALEKNKIVMDKTQGEGKLSCVALEEFDKKQKQQQQYQQLARQSSCCSCKSSNSNSSHNNNNNNNTGKSSESCPSEDIDDHTDVDNENENEIPPPPTSTWNLSPLYEVAVNTSSECISTDDTPKTLNNNNIPNVSECSITPVVYSLASLADIFSGDEIATRCSTVSTVTNYDNFDASTEQGKGNNGMCMDELSEQRLLQLLGQYNKTEEQKKKREIMDKLMENIAATPLPSAKTLDESSDKDLQQDQTDKETEEDDDANESQNKNSKIFCPINTEEKIRILEKNESGKISPKKVKNTELELRKSALSILKKNSSSEIKKSNKKKKAKKSKRKDKDDEGESSGGEEEKENRVKVKKPKAITLFKCNSLKIPGNGEDGITGRGDDAGESPIQKLKNSLPRTPGGRFAFSSKEAEIAIAKYVKDELAASLDVGSEAKLKPGKLRDVLCSVSNGVDKCHSSSCQTCEVQTTIIPMKREKDKANNKEQKDNKDKDNKGCKGEKTTGAHHHHNTNNSSSNIKSQIPVKKKHPPPVTKKPLLKPPLPPPLLPPRPLNCGIIPKQSNRINFIRYQQQSIAAMLNISRNRLRNQKSGYHRPLDRTVNVNPVNQFPRSQNNPRELLDFTKKKETLNARLRPNNRNVTVVFGHTHNLNNIQNNNNNNNTNNSS